MDDHIFIKKPSSTNFKHLEKIFGNSSLGVIIIDKQTNIKYLNQAIENILHHNTDKYIGKPLSKLNTNQQTELQMMEDSHLETIKLYVETEKIKAELENKNQQLDNLIFNTISTLTKVLEARDSYSKGHSINVSKVAMDLAKKMGLSSENVKDITYAGLFHDLGKIKVTENILTKPEKLSESEFEEIKNHPKWAVDILSPITEFKNILPDIYHHHEKYDGTGYPDKIKGTSIPIGARILSLAEAFVSITSNKNYEKAKPNTEAMHIIADNAGAQFCPSCVKYFLKGKNPALISIH